jgi:hypothetical protein
MMFVAILLLLLLSLGAPPAVEAGTRRLENKKEFVEVHMKAVSGFQGKVSDAMNLLERSRGSAATDTQQSVRHGSRGLKIKGGGNSEAYSCKAELAALKQQALKPHYLFVQMANHCTLSRSDGSYTLSSLDVADTTWQFTDRPLQLEESMETTEFFDNLIPCLLRTLVANRTLP